MRRLLAVALVGVACTSPANPAPSTAERDVPSTTPVASGAVAGVDAANGLGDRLFPELGNAGYDVTRYALDLTFDGALTSLEGRAVIEAEAGPALRSFTLDFVGYTVESVHVDGTPAQHARGPRDMRVTPSETIPAGAPFTVEVRYAGSPDAVRLTEFPFPTGWQRGERGSLFLFSEPDGASGVFPANDHPSDRADVDLTVSVPAPLVVVSGGRRLPVQRDVDRLVYRFELPAVAPYLLPLAIGDFDSVAGADGIVTWIGRGTDLPRGFDRQGEILRFLETQLGPYPFDSAGAVVVESDLPAALESQTLATYTTTSAAWGEPVIAHELAHHWFGNDIALGQWDDIWLNEGFATFMTWRWIEHDRGREAYDGEVLRTWQAMAAVTDPAPPDHPAGQDLFSPSVYSRGGLTLVALREFVGDEEFFDFLRSYVAEFSGKTVTTEGFLTFVLIVLGPAAEDLVTDWIRRPALPELPGAGS